MNLRKKKRLRGWELNIAPLIDVVFQLIIFGLVVSSFARVEAEDITLPEARQGEAPPGLKTLRLVINVRQGGDLLVRGRPCSAEALGGVLASEAAGGKAAALEVLIRADRQTDWKHVAKAMAACAAKGIGKVRVAVTEPQAASGP
jgi:biopolymer transport protein ExbD